MKSYDRLLKLANKFVRKIAEEMETDNEEEVLLKHVTKSEFRKRITECVSHALREVIENEDNARPIQSDVDDDFFKHHRDGTPIPLTAEMMVRNIEYCLQSYRFKLMIARPRIIDLTYWHKNARKPVKEVCQSILDNEVTLEQGISDIVDCIYRFGIAVNHQK
jgi:hypothetical protein